MSTTTTLSNDEAQIRERLDEWTRALHAKDLDALMSLYEPDTVVFDLMAPAQVKGRDRYRKNFERWFAALPAPIEYEINDLRIAAGEDVAFCHSLSRVRGTRANGDKADYWVRVTVGFRKRDGRWMMIHDHVSMPLDETMKAVPDLQR
jgi:uncharacterized protein (TIGR02246 family)